MNSIEIADAVVELLNNSSAFDSDFTAERKLLPVFELKDLETVKVSIVPLSAEYTLINRAALTTDYQVNIGIQKKVSNPESELEDLIDLAESIVLYLKGKTLITTPNAYWVRTVNEPVYDRQHLSEQLVFTSIITVTYRVIR